MPPHENTKRLLHLMSVCRLSVKAVAEMTGRSVQTVKIWRCSNNQIIPSRYLAVLEMHYQRQKAIEFIDSRLEYLFTARGAALITERAIELATACRAYRQSGLLTLEAYKDCLSAGRQFLEKLGIALPSSFLEEN